MTSPCLRKFQGIIDRFKRVALVAAKRRLNRVHIIPDAMAQLKAIGWEPDEAQGMGDCSVLSIHAGHEIRGIRA